MGNTRKHNIQESQEVSPFSTGDQGCKEQTRQYDRHTQKTNNKVILHVVFITVSSEACGFEMLNKHAP